MSKELTEKWKKKELKDGDYYVLNKAGDIVCDYYIEILGHFDSVLTENVKEVLAPAPSYDEYKELVKKSDKLDKIMSDAVTNQGDCQQIVEDNLNRQIKRLQEQLNEANDIIISIAVMPRFPINPELCREYLEKWGVK